MKLDRDFLQENVKKVIVETNFNFPSELKPKKIAGKVRDSYVFGKDHRLLVATDRLSAFDVILTALPFKGDILTKLSLFWFDKTEDIISNHIVKEVAGNAVLVKNCEVVPIEVIVRGYLAGSYWRAYRDGKEIKDASLPAGMKEYDAFPEPLVCFTTKADIGDHDEPITKAEILEQKIVSPEELDFIAKTALDLYNRGNEIVNKNNLILVDTKYEFGRRDDKVVLVDEIHTQDSSRFIIQSDYKAGKITELDKEFFRQWLISKGYNGEGTPPVIPDEVKVDVVLKYIEAYKMITGEEPKLIPQAEDYSLQLEKKVIDLIK